MTVPALAADGSCWSFRDTCLPDGFTAIAGDDACAQAAYTATCESLPENRECETFPLEAVLFRLADGCSATIRQFVGCAVGSGCSEFPVEAWAPDGACWTFSTGCVPADFVVATQGDGCRHADVVVCGRSPDPVSCADRTYVDGRRFDPARGCLEASEPVGCVPETTCEGALVPARRFDTTCWLVPASCVPSGFTVAAPNDPCADVAPLPACDG